MFIGDEGVIYGVLTRFTVSFLLLFHKNKNKKKYKQAQKLNQIGSSREEEKAVNAYIPSLPITTNEDFLITVDLQWVYRDPRFGVPGR